MKKVCVVLLLIMLSGCVYSDGDRSGVVRKFSRKGFIFKTYEGELVMDGFTTTNTKFGGNMTNVWRFSCNDKEVVKDLQYAERGHYSVVLQYEQIVPNNPFRGSTQYYIVKVTKTN